MAKHILSIMNMIEILFMNIDSLRTKDWDNFLASLGLMVSWMIVYDNKNYSRWLQPMVTSVLDGNAFFVAIALSTNKRNFFSILDWKCIFLFTS